MARLFTDGAEYGDLLFFDNINGTPSASTTQKRTGAYSYFLSAGNWGEKYITAIDEIYVRIAFWFPLSYDYYACFSIRNGATDLVVLVNDPSTHKMEVRMSSYLGTLLYTSNDAILLGQWFFVELHYKIHDSAGVVELKFNGISQGSAFVGDTKPGAEADFDTMHYYSQSGGGFYIDDIAGNDINGGVDDSWCGDGHVELLVPSGNSPDGGWTDDFTGSDADSTDNYALVDEVPPNAADYVESSTPGDQDRYALTDFSGAGKQILRVWVEGRALDTIPEGAQMKLGLRLASADYLSSAITLSSIYGAVLGTVYKQNPATGPADWIDSDIDNAQIVIETV